MKLFESNREVEIVYLNPTQGTESKYHKGSWIVEFEHDMKGVGEYIERGKYIQINTPQGLQFFKIRMISKISESKIKVTAFHRMYDLTGNYIEDTYIKNKNRVEAARQILNNTLRPSGFNVIGNTGVTNNNLRIVGYNPFKALLGDEDNTLLSRYGGEWDFNNDTFIIEDIIGKDKGYLITYNKGMVELNESEDDTNLVTQIIPIGKERLMLPEITVDSFYINNYDEIYTKEVDFKDIGIDEENGITEEKAIELLREAARNYFLTTQCDLIETSYEITMEDIKNKAKYKEFSFLYTINNGDYVTVLKNNGVKLKVRLMYYQRDIVKDEFIKLQLNNTKRKGSADSGKIDKQISNVLNSNGTVNTQKLEGLVNLLKVNLGAMVDSAELHNSKAILFEDRIVDSATYGALAIGTKGFMISSEFDSTKNDWKWSTFGTGQGFVADHIISGILSSILIKSINGNVEIDLSEDEIVKIKGGALQVQNDNGTVVIDGKYNMHKILISGVTSISFAENESTVTKSIQHNLGYKPCFSCYVESREGYVFNFPYLEYNNFSTETIGTNVLGRAWCNSSKLEIVFKRAQYLTNPETYTIKYYIYKEVAI